MDGDVRKGPPACRSHLCSHLLWMRRRSHCLAWDGKRLEACATLGRALRWDAAARVRLRCGLPMPPPTPRPHCSDTRSPRSQLWGHFTKCHRRCPGLNYSCYIVVIIKLFFLCYRHVTLSVMCFFRVCVTFTLSFDFFYILKFWFEFLTLENTTFAFKI